MKPTNLKRLFCRSLATLFILVISSLSAFAQAKFFSHPASNDQFAFSASNENYTFYSVSAGNTDGGFRYMGIIREDKKTKERVVMYEGAPFSDLKVSGNWLYFNTWEEARGYIRRMTIDGSKTEWIKVGTWPFLYKDKLYYTEGNALKFYDLKTGAIKIASKELTGVSGICNDVAVCLEHQQSSYQLAHLDPVSGVVKSVERFRLNGLNYYYGAQVMVNDGYIYYCGGKDEDQHLYLNETSAIYRSKLGDNYAFAEPVAYPPTTKTGASLDMSSRIGVVMDDNCIYINYRGAASPNNGEIWRYSLDGKEKKRVTILLTDNMSKCEDWIYTMGQWTWEQRRTNVKTGKQELLFQGKAENLAALAGLKHLAVPFTNILFPNNPAVIVDKQHTYRQMGYSLSTRKDATKYYRIADVAKMLSKTKKAFNYTISDGKVTFTFGSYNPVEQVKERADNIAIPAVSEKGTFVAGSNKKPVTYYVADGEYFFLFRDILGILGVAVNGSNVTTTSTDPVR